MALAAIVVAVATLLLGTARAPSSAATVDFAPTERHARVARLVSSMFERSHYRQAPVNDPVSSLVLDRYLESLDGLRSYFTAADIEEFERYRYELDDAILEGKLEPAFEIFNRYQQRSRERMKFALAVLDKEPDFTLDESFEFDRRKAPWAKDSAELDELWRKRVKNDAISLMLADKTWPEAREVLQKRYERAAFSPRNSEEYRIQMSLSYEGIGASLQMIDDYVTIMEIIPGGSAQQSGELKATDRIVAVGQDKSGEMVDVVGWRLDDVVDLIRGPQGSFVRLQIQPGKASTDATERVITLPRNKITLEAQAAKKELRTIDRGDRKLRIGVITVPSFYQDYNARAAGDDEFRSTTRDVRRLLEQFEAEGGIDGLVLDLRGGVAAMCMGVAGHFHGQPDSLGTMRTREATLEFRVNPRRSTADGRSVEPFAGPLVIVTDPLSASTSEIFAAGLQALGRARVVGRASAGAALPAQMRELPGGDGLIFAFADFTLPDGRHIEGVGVQPDEPSGVESVAWSAEADPDLTTAARCIAKALRDADCH